MHPMAALLLLCSFFPFLHYTSATGQQARVNRAGVVYGSFGNNLPTTQEAVSLIKSLHTERVRLYGPDYSVLQALRNTGIEVVLGVPNYELQSIASGQWKADQWIQKNVKNFQQHINFRYIVVGNGISTQYQYAEFLQKAMQNIQNAITSSGLKDKIKVTTALDHSSALSLIHPPSKAEFNPSIKEFFIDPIIEFLINNNAPLLINLHPYYSYAFDQPEIPQELNKDMNQTSRDIRLEYANFRSPSVLVRDGSFGYNNVFDAMVDAVYNALENTGVSSLDVVVSESGWPTAGGPGANQDNAGAYNNNLIRHVKRNGTPKRPEKPVETYIYNLFDENQKIPEIERHWGIFETNKQAKYPISFWSPKE